MFGRGGNKARPGARSRRLWHVKEQWIEQLARSGLASVIEELGDEVRKGGKLGLLITGAVDLALCLANRRAGVRAVRGAESECVRRAVESIGANLLVLDLAGKSLFQQLKNRARVYLAWAAGLSAGLGEDLGISESRNIYHADR